MKMLRVRQVVVSMVMLGMVMGGASAAQAQESRIGFVSLERILRESAPAKQSQQKLEAEFAKRGKEISDLDAKLKGASEKLQKDAAVLTESDRMKRQRELTDQDRELQRRQREFNEDLNQRRNEELAVVLERANKVIKQIAESEKYDLIFQEAVFASPRIDITDKVLRALGNGGSGK